MAKPRFASLTAGLLARKGEAHPAAESFAVMAGHGVSSGSEPRLVREPSAAESHQFGLHDELEWMTSMSPIGADTPPPPYRPPPEPPRLRSVPKPMAALTSANALLLRIGKAPKPATARESAISRDAALSHARRVSVSVRLDEPRYLRLKIAAMRLQRTGQDLMTKALDAYLTALGIEPLTDAEVEAVKATTAKTQG